MILSRASTQARLVPAAAALLALVTMTAPAAATSASVDQAQVCLECHDDVASEIRLPVEHPTMCTFGGENLDILYVTSTSKFLKPEAAADQPLAGALFAIHGCGATGFPETFFAG